MNSITPILLGLVIFGYIMYRQLQEKPVREDRGYRGSVIICIIGLISAGSTLNKYSMIPAAAYGIISASMIIGVVLAVFRARFVHLWRDHGKLVRKGNWLTLLLWIIGIIIHIGSDLLLKSQGGHADDLGSSTLTLYIGISLFVQQAVLIQRAETAKEKYEEHIRKANS
jgi:hypothetical protein